MRYIKLYESYKGITFREWLKDNSQDKGVKKIDCSESNLIDLDGIEEFNELKVLQCSYNQLTFIPKLPNSLETLWCSNNRLTEIYHLPDTLKMLYCFNNKLTSLPKLPDTLMELYCPYNQLPYNNLKEYKVWHRKTYPYLYKAKRYNI